MARASAGTEWRVDGLVVSAYTVPTDGPEADGTLAWSSTTLVLVEVEAGGTQGLGYTYGDAAAARLIDGTLAPLVRGRDPMAVPAIWRDLVRKVRNVGRPGLASMAVAAVDTALWDLKAKLLDLPLVTLLGAAREAVPAYGSGGFLTYDVSRLREQLGSWAAQGLRMVKMKVGAGTDEARRVRAAREAIGPDIALFVDANGAYGRKEALACAEDFAASGVVWFEEPVSSDDLDGLRLVARRAPAGMEVAAGEYGYDLPYFERMLAAGAVDVLQADATRCAGITGFLGVGALCQAHGIELSAHTAPSLHAPVCCALPAARHVEYFYDHARIEAAFFDGALVPVDGALRPDRSRPGLGLELRRRDAERWLVR